MKRSSGLSIVVPYAKLGPCWRPVSSLSKLIQCACILFVGIIISGIIRKTRENGEETRVIVELHREMKNAGRL